MSDDEEFIYVKKQKTIHYGSLEDQERARLQAQLIASKVEKAEDDGEEKPATEAPAVVPTAEIHVSNEYMQLEDAISRDKQALLEEFERRKKARQINVSTDDAEVKLDLRQLGEPICLFGEGPADRRQRLRDLLSFLGEDAIKKKIEQEHERKQQAKDQESTWYHEGSEQLRLARLWIGEYSLERAKARLDEARAYIELPTPTRTARIQEVQKKMQAMTIHSSQVGDNRPISYCNFSPDSKMLATSSWSGLCKVWSIPDCELMQTLRGHACNVGCIVFHPKSHLTDNLPCTLASGAHDGTVLLWGLKSETPITSIDTHYNNRVSRLQFHPSGRFIGTCCFDSSWRLWDLEQETEILHQEGHCRPVHCISFQVDGSVCATGSHDAFGRVWDLRTGRCIMFMEGHLKSIIGIDFSPDGYHIATASEDNTCKIWDLRKRDLVYTIPAHTNLISDVKFQKETGNFLVTASYDNTVKIWNNKTWQPLKKLSGHDGKVMSVDVSPDSTFIATSSYDRTFKLWSPEL